MKTRVGLVLFLAFSVSAFAQAGKCFVCGDRIGTLFYMKVDQVTERKETVCPACAELHTICFACGLPAKDNLVQLPDRRVYCARDAKNAIFTDEEMRQACNEACEELTRSFSRFLTFPIARTTVSFVDRLQIETMFKSPGADRACPAVYGHVKTTTNEQGRVEHHVGLLTGLPRRRTEAAAAHELAHAWLHENMPDTRAVSHDAVEGFCELIAYKLMQEVGDAYEKTLIAKNKYTRGQLELFIAADERHGLNTLLEWMKAGVDAALDPQDLDRVRLVKAVPRPAGGVPLHVLAAQQTPVPDTLTLKAITGKDSRRLALINDRALAVNEEGKVRVGTSNVALRLLEIRQDSAVVQVTGAEERLELRLKSK